MHQKLGTSLPSKSPVYQPCLGGDGKQEITQNKMEVYSPWFTVFHPENFPWGTLPSYEPLCQSLFSNSPPPTPSQVMKHCMRLVKMLFKCRMLLSSYITQISFLGRPRCQNDASQHSYYLGYSILSLC